jgi:hypothetical protein
VGGILALVGIHHQELATTRAFLRDGVFSRSRPTDALRIRYLAFVVISCSRARLVKMLVRRKVDCGDNHFATIGVVFPKLYVGALRVSLKLRVHEPKRHLTPLTQLEE